MKSIIGNAKNLRIFLICCDLILIFLLSIFYYLLLPIKTNSVVFIPQGSVSKIITQLDKNNYKMSGIDKYTLYLLGHPQSGWINIGTKELNRAEFLHKLTVAKAALETITLIPGETTEIFFEELAPKLNLNAKTLMQEFYKQSPFKEGMLFPETYKIPKGITEELLVKYLLAYSANEFKKLSYKIFREYNEKKWHEYIIIASIIQKEAASNEEMSIVSSVIRNRLRKGMKLQMDGTLNYGKYSHEKITPQRIRSDNSSYNTYKFNGIPKEAVCNVSFEAIKAAIFPAKTEYLYFVRDKKTNKHIFTSTLKDHNKAIRN
ncbi:endolytic transglycosylase MltG [Campylobacter lari]|uniref:endolytic transglycosylase MltG n=1 Tax=Campylobacter lari TaxID=201 RepID=UPI0021F6C928|nr:endolytic transglycosylase MltG [Campylobacter lari]MCW0183985.1 endolytic transglycosylase MltG [Campylobacter lari]